MRRRQFLSLLGGAAAWPFAAVAQQPATPVIGFLGSESPDLFAGRLGAFHQGLGEAGFLDGRNVAVEYRWAHGRNDRLPELAVDLVRRQVTVIATVGGTPVARAAKAATKVIPVVFQVGVDPIAAGLVASLNQPGGNLTGVTTLGVELGPKRLELLRELAPTATTMALLVNPTNPVVADAHVRDMQAAARLLGLKLHVLHAGVESEFEAIFAGLKEQRVGGLVIGNDGFLNSRSEQLAALALRHAVLAIHNYRPFAVAGGLASYGGSFADPYRHLGIYTGRILKGEKPAGLPVIQSTKFELVVNLKTAKALGLDVPLALLARADEVIE